MWHVCARVCIVCVRLWEREGQWEAVCVPRVGVRFIAWWGCAEARGCVSLGNCSKHVLCVPALWTSDVSVGVCLCAHGPRWELSAGVCGEGLRVQHRLQGEGGTRGHRRGHLLAS